MRGTPSALCAGNFSDHNMDNKIVSNSNQGKWILIPGCMTVIGMAGCMDCIIKTRF